MIVHPLICTIALYSEYDPHPLLLLTKRRRTLSTSESSEPRISCSNIPPSPKENKIKRGPGRPPKADRLISEESIGDEDVFTNGNANDEKTESDDDTKSNKSEKTSSKNQKNEQKGRLDIFNIVFVVLSASLEGIRDNNYGITYIRLLKTNYANWRELER